MANYSALDRRYDSRYLVWCGWVGPCARRPGGYLDGVAGSGAVVSNGAVCLDGFDLRPGARSGSECASLLRVAAAWRRRLMGHGPMNRERNPLVRFCNLGDGRRSVGSPELHTFTRTDWLVYHSASWSDMARSWVDRHYFILWPWRALTYTARIYDGFTAKIRWLGGASDHQASLTVWIALILAFAAQLVRHSPAPTALSRRYLQHRRRQDLESWR